MMEFKKEVQELLTDLNGEQLLPPVAQRVALLTAKIDEVRGGVYTALLEAEIAGAQITAANNNKTVAIIEGHIERAENLTRVGVRLVEMLRALEPELQLVEGGAHVQA
jgi:hypothetical protein